MSELFHLNTSRVIDQNGIADGANIYFYQTGTLTPAATYADDARTTPHPHPIPVASGAAVPNIYLDPAITYRCIVKNAAGETIDDTDPYSGIAANGIRTSTGDTVQGALDAFGSSVDGKGDSLVAHKRTASASVTSVHGKLRNIVYAKEDYGFTPGGDETANAAALQAAVNDAQVIILPDDAVSVATYNATVDIPPYTKLIGNGRYRSRVVANAALALRYLAPNGTETAGPWLSDFALASTGSCIKLNDAAGGYTEDGTTQKTIFRPRLERMFIDGPGAATAGSIGVEWNKCFDGVLDQCEIRDFETGYKSLGSDLILIGGRTRIWMCGTLLDIASTGTFGSGTIIDGADLLKASVRFLRSSDKHLQVRGSYFECSTTTATDCVLDIAHNYISVFRDNRFETPSTKAVTFMRVRGDGNLFAFENNQTGGTSWGAVDWKNSDGTKDGAAYFKNTTYRQIIRAVGNITGMGGPALFPVPFNTAHTKAVRNHYRDMWVLTPAGAGLRNTNYGPTVRVKDGAFVLPALASAGSLIRFINVDEEYPLTGTVNIHVRAKAATAGQTLSVQRLNGSTPIATVTHALTTDYAWYTSFSGVAVTNLDLRLFNEDTTTNSDAFIEEIVVERA